MGGRRDTQDTGQLTVLMGKMFNSTYFFIRKLPTCLPETGQEGSINGGRIVPDGVLAAKEDARSVLDHVVALTGVAGDDQGGQNVIVVTTGPLRYRAASVGRKDNERNGSERKTCSKGRLAIG